MRHIRIAAILAFLLIVTQMHAFADQSPTQAPTALPLPALRPGTFQGVTPCADCPGVQVTVTLKADGTYTLKRVYLERKGTFDESGTWSYDVQRARLTLFPNGKAAPELFSVSFSAQLHVLDADGNPLPAQMNSALTEVEPTATLASTGWTLVELGGKPFTASEQHPVTMQFDALGERVSGSGGCNRYSGSYKQDGDRLSFSPLASTKMMCANISQEDAYFAMLTRVTSFKRESEWLTLYDKGGNALAKFGYEK